MLVNAKDMLNKALLNKKVIFQFNVNNLEWAKYIIEETSELNQDVILGFSEGAIKYMGGYNTAVMVVKGLIKDINPNNNICLHLDHGRSIESCVKAIDAGFTSVMIDASTFDLDTNINMTKEVCEYAKDKSVSVEAELGYIGDSNSLIKNTKIEDCVYFVEKTNVDFLAPALGNVHGIYKEKPNLDFISMKEISEKTNVPLVLHGGTGISNKDLKKAVECGVCKININTELQLAWHEGVIEFIKNNINIYDPRKVIASGEKNIKKAIRDKILEFK